MSDITTDFIKATNKIYAKVAAILTNLQIIESDVKLIRDNSIKNAHEPEAQANARDSQGDPEATICVHGNTAKGRKANRDKNNGKDEDGNGFHRFKKRWKKSLRKPVVQLEIAALIGLALYTCETRRTNELTEKAVNLQFSLSRAFVQITGNDFLKNSFEDVQKAGQFYLEIQTSGNRQLPKSMEILSLNFHSPIKNRLLISPNIIRT
jgi:hypothetical protein